MSGGLSAAGPFIGLGLGVLVLWLVSALVIWLAARLAGLRPRLGRCLLLALALAILAGLFRLAAAFLPVPAGGWLLLAAQLLLALVIIKAFLAASWPRAIVVGACYAGLMVLAALATSLI